jgi:LPS sulfotransferase NodH
VSGAEERRRLFTVVGTQRTGTTLLRDILNSNAEVAMAAEIMIPYPDNCHWNRFVPTLPEGWLPPRDEAAGLALFDRYFEHFDNEIWTNWKEPKRRAHVIGVDIKCDQFRLVEPVGWPAAAPPFLLHYAQTRGVVLINTIRRNVVQCMISYMLGLQRDFWHNYEGRKVERAYELDIDESLAWARGIVQQQRELELFTRDSLVVRCYYEDLVEAIADADPDKDLSDHPGVLHDIAAALGVPRRFRYDGRLQRATNKPYPEIIANYDAFLAAIEASEFAPWAATIR